MENLLESKIYVGTYGKYNAGSIKGKWMTLSDYESKEAFLKAARELHNDEADPEFMFQDIEDYPEDFYQESSIEDVWPFINRVKKWSEGYYKKFLNWCDENGALPTIECIEEYKASYKKSRKDKDGKSSTSKKEAEAMKLLKVVYEKESNRPESYLKYISTAIRLSGGQLIEFEKPKIETRFCFSYDSYADAHGGTTFKEAQEKCEAAETWGYFKNRNLSNYDYILNGLRGEKNEWGNVGTPYICNHWCFTDKIYVLHIDTRYGDAIEDNHGMKLNEEDIRLLTKVVESERAKFLKRLEAYWKRYGASKLHTWTYDSND